jgi:transcriptional regulator with XRE-family HTH domain
VPQLRPYQFSNVIGASCARLSRTFDDLAGKLGMDVHQFMREWNGHAPPSKGLVRGLARELDITEWYLDKLADEVRKDLGTE